VWQKSIKGSIGQLLIEQYQTVASVLDISEPLNESSHRFIIPLSQASQIGQLQFSNSREEELMELPF